MSECIPESSHQVGTRILLKYDDIWYECCIEAVNRQLGLVTLIFEGGLLKVENYPLEDSRLLVSRKRVLAPSPDAAARRQRVETLGNPLTKLAEMPFEALERLFANTAELKALCGNESAFAFVAHTTDTQRELNALVDAAVQELTSLLNSQGNICNLVQAAASYGVTVERMTSLMCASRSDIDLSAIDLTTKLSRRGQGSVLAELVSVMRRILVAESHRLALASILCLDKQ
jgi:hypothetical protein